MKILVSGSAGHLGEALMRTLKDSDHEAVGLDIKSSPFTHRVGSITERRFVKQCMQDVDVVLHTALVSVDTSSAQPRLLPETSCTSCEQTSSPW